MAGTLIPDFSVSRLLIFFVLFSLLSRGALAFGAGSIPNYAYLHDRAFRHGDIANILLTLAKRPVSEDGSDGGSGGLVELLATIFAEGIASVFRSTTAPTFSKADVQRVYFGNWLRDYSQAMDIAGLTKTSHDTLLLIVQALGFMSFDYATREFFISKQRLGVYLPVEHIDNPKGYAADLPDGDARRVHPSLRPPVDPRELEIDPQTGMKNYIANEAAAEWDTSSAHVRRTLRECIEKGRRAHTRRPHRSREANGDRVVDRQRRRRRQRSPPQSSGRNREHSRIRVEDYPEEREDDEIDECEDMWEAFRLLGSALHTLEDLLAHSNWCELALRRLGYREVFCHVGDAVRIRSPSGRSVPPLVTGTFGSADFLHSVLGEASDHVSQASVVNLTVHLEEADTTFGSFTTLRKLISLLPAAVVGSTKLDADANEITTGRLERRAHRQREKVEEDLQRWHARTSDARVRQGEGTRPHSGGTNAAVAANGPVSYAREEDKDMGDDEDDDENEEWADAEETHSSASSSLGFVTESDEFDFARFVPSLETQEFLWDVLAWRDNIVRTLVELISGVPGLLELLEQMMDVLNQCVYTLLAPVLVPIAKEVMKALKDESRAIINTADQYEVFDNPHASDPTHSLLAKDHVDLVLNEPAGRVARTVVEHTVGLVVHAWYDTDDNIDKVIHQVLEVFHHPYFARRSSRIQRGMRRTVRTWLEELELDERVQMLSGLSKQGVREGRNKRTAREPSDSADDTMSSLDGSCYSYSSNEGHGRYSPIRRSSSRYSSRQRTQQREESGVRVRFEDSDSQREREREQIATDLDPGSRHTHVEMPTEHIEVVQAPLDREHQQIQQTMQQHEERGQRGEQEKVRPQDQPDYYRNRMRSDFEIMPQNADALEEERQHVRDQLDRDRWRHREIIGAAIGAAIAGAASAAGSSLLHPRSPTPPPLQQLPARIATASPRVASASHKFESTPASIARPGPEPGPGPVDESESRSGSTSGSAGISLVALPPSSPVTSTSDLRLAQVPSLSVHQPTGAGHQKTDRKPLLQPPIPASTATSSSLQESQQQQSPRPPPPPKKPKPLELRAPPIRPRAPSISNLAVDAIVLATPAVAVGAIGSVFAAQSGSKSTSKPIPDSAAATASPSTHRTEDPRPAPDPGATEAPARTLDLQPALAGAPTSVQGVTSTLSSTTAATAATAGTSTGAPARSSSRASSRTHLSNPAPKSIRMPIRRPTLPLAPALTPAHALADAQARTSLSMPVPMPVPTIARDSGIGSLTSSASLPVPALVSKPLPMPPPALRKGRSSESEHASSMASSEWSSKDGNDEQWVRVDTPKHVESSDNGDPASMGMDMTTQSILPDPSADVKSTESHARYENHQLSEKERLLAEDGAKREVETARGEREWDEADFEADYKDECGYGVGIGATAPDDEAGTLEAALFGQDAKEDEEEGERLYFGGGFSVRIDPETGPAPFVFPPDWQQDSGPENYSGPKNEKRQATPPPTAENDGSCSTPGAEDHGAPVDDETKSDHESGWTSTNDQAGQNGKAEGPGDKDADYEQRGDPPAYRP